MSLFGALSVSASGMAAQRTRAELLTENLANSETTRTAEGGPYRRQDAVFETQPQSSPFSSVFQDQLGEGMTGVQVSDIVLDSSPPDKRYIPGHPDADASGYVSFPHISPAEDMVDLLSSARGYEANVAAMSAVKGMISSSIDLLRT
jgi:flagellar basal-body rod protein FlgC